MAAMNQMPDASIFDLARRAANDCGDAWTALSRAEVQASRLPAQNSGMWVRPAEGWVDLRRDGDARQARRASA
jgi:hypothetical protein